MCYEIRRTALTARVFPLMTAGIAPLMAVNSSAFSPLSGGGCSVNGR